MNTDRTLEIILRHQMNEQEAKAFKIASMYLEKAQKFFPNYQHYRMPKGDPRKSELFRYCYTLLTKTQGKIQDSEYELYIHAQLDILKNIKKGKTHPIISPACLTGQKAWKRWLLWKSKYDKLIETRSSSNIAETINVHNLEKIKKDLWKTKQFLIAWFDKLDVKDLKDAFKDKNIFRWYQTGSICGYFFIISSVATDWIDKNKIDLKKEFGLDLEKYKVASQTEVIEYFNKEFGPEF